MPQRQTQKDFTHVNNLTDYMRSVIKIITTSTKPCKVLDIPAGNGLIGEQLTSQGYTVTCADINREKPNFVYANLDKKLPFADQEFNVTICMEGIEHTIYPAQCISELCRITAYQGKIILTLPNIQNIFSRIKFLCTGSFYQFEPWFNRHFNQDKELDCGHISSLSYLQLHYLFQHNDAQLLYLRGDRWKKKWLIPLILPFVAIGWIWSKIELNKRVKRDKDFYSNKIRNLFSPTLLFSRSLILVFEKKHLDSEIRWD